MSPRAVQLAAVVAFQRPKVALRCPALDQQGNTPLFSIGESSFSFPSNLCVVSSEELRSFREHTENTPCTAEQERRFRPVQSGLDPRNQGVDLEVVGCFLSLSDCSYSISSYIC